MSLPGAGGLPVADSHNDLLLAVRYQRERGASDPFGDFWLPQLREGNVKLQVLPVSTEEQYVGEGALRRAMLLFEEARRIAEEHAADVAIAETSAELDEVLDSGRIALLLAIEGAEPVGNNLELLDTFWRAGVRMTSLSWNRRTMMADGVAETDTGGALTKLGVDAVKRMEQLGMVVDASHLSKRGFYHLAEVAERPFIASHSSCDAVHAHPRNLDDEQLAVMRASGSLLCLNAFGPFLASDADAESYIAHIEHAVAQLGSTSVAFGTDFIKDTAGVVDPIFTGLLVSLDEILHTDGLIRPADFPDLTRALTARLGEHAARAISADNLINFLRAALP